MKRFMPNQRTIAALAGVTQAAVSRALRNDPSISEETRRKVYEAAKELGYRPNAYVSTLMAHIRSGRPPRDKGCIAVIVNAASLVDWWGQHAGSETYRLQYQGMMRRAEELGFQTECFFLKAPHMTAGRIDQILNARGISGVILAPPTHPVKSRIDFTWKRYAAAMIAYGWTIPNIDHVAADHLRNVQIAHKQLTLRGYRRIGMCLPPGAVANIGVAAPWKTGYLVWQDQLPESERIPLFIGQPGLTPIERFHDWLKHWKPEAIVCLLGHEKEWLDTLGWSIPADLGLVCVNRPLASEFSGLEERSEAVGAAVTELVISKILQNELGPAEYSKLLLIEGAWVEGGTIRPVPGIC